MLGHALLTAATLAGSVTAGTVLWDGRFNEFNSSADLNNWSWANQVGPYQYYIHGTGDVTDYVNLSPSYKNPADTASTQGARITIDPTAKWNSDMWRTELIPQTTAAIAAGTVSYHFSISRSATNAPSTAHEHQVNFFESHFTELKYGWISGEAGETNANLQWMVGGVSKWAVGFEPDVWHNVAYEIDFDGGTVAFWHSTGAEPLVRTVAPVAASAGSNGADWHLGVLRLPRSGYDTGDAEDWFFSGVYVESGDVTTSVAGPGEHSGFSSSSSSSSSSTAPASPPTVASSFSASSNGTSLSTEIADVTIPQPRVSMTAPVSVTPVVSATTLEMTTSSVAANPTGGTAKL